MTEPGATLERLERENAELRARLEALEARLRASGEPPTRPRRDPVDQLALWDSEARFSAAFDFSPVAMTQTRLSDRTFVDVNAAFLKDTGYAREEVIGRTDEDLGLFADPAGRDRLLRQMRATGTAYGASVALRRKHGEVRTCLFSTAVIQIAGEPHALSSIIDVTEREQAQRELHRSEERFALAFQSAPYAITITRVEDGRFLDVNEAFTTITGYPRDEALADTSIGLRIWALPEDRERVVVALRAGQVVSGDEFVFRGKAGQRIVGLFTARLLHLSQGACILSSVNDITGRRRTEHELERLAAAIDQAAEAVVVTDAQGSIEYVNPAFEAVTGYSRAEVLGRNPRLLQSGVQDAAFYRELWETLASGRTWHGRLVNRRKDGTRYTEEATLSPVRDAAGVTTSYVGVKRDITGDLAREAQLQQALRLESIGRLAGGIAHDFNNLLAVIQGTVGLALDGVRETDPLRRDLAQIQDASARAVALTRQLLAFGRRQVLRTELLDVNGLLGPLEHLLGRIIGEDIEIDLALEPGLGRVRADPGQLEQVILNLALAARDAMPRGGRLTLGSASVTFEEGDAARPEGVSPGLHVMITVTDTGVGLDSGTQARIFDPFFTPRGAGPGSGLGLATAYGIVRQSRGTITVRSEVGVGSTFTVYLPREAEGAAPAPAPARTSGAAGETVLVVEDDEAVRQLTERLLSTAGYRVLTAASGGEALDLSERHPGEIHLLLTDVVMPRMSGQDLAERLGRVRPGLRVLYMSGYTDTAIAYHRVVDPGAWFIDKPFTRTDLLQQVRAALDAERPA